MTENSWQGAAAFRQADPAVPEQPNPVAARSRRPDTGRDADVITSYTLAVEMADRVSARRGAANSFFLGIQTTLLAAVGLADSTVHNISWYAALSVTLTGCTISAFWWLQLRSYQLLNQAKFEVINKLEEQLPAKIYTDEWTSLKQVRRSRRFRYLELGTTERFVPLLLAALHVLLLVGRLSG
ncbi:hypothetical protein [Streptomyces sp. NBRC 110028]|uniref:RipA family octameric membrane protein n=1 Tax=Streptomyces sp. NBRC 110028 TaxID=1621260 RepID=UPI000AE5D93A|nr:hypothetical protein [Streptomyces sp. NBRC 110028]